MTTSEAHLSAWLTLCFCPRIGGKIMTRLWAVDSPENILKYSTDRLIALGLSSTQITYLQSSEHKEVNQCLEWQNQSALNTIVALTNPIYPKLLSEISAPPLFYLLRETLLRYLNHKSLS